MPAAPRWLAGLCAVSLLAAACVDPDDPEIVPEVAAPAPAPVPPAEPARGMAPVPGAESPFVSPAVDRFTLGNGIEVLLVERHTLPTVYWQIQFPTGSVNDPTGKEGMSALCMWLLVQGGAPDTVTRLADMGSDLSANWTLDTVSLSGFALTQHFDATLDLWALTLAQPGKYAAQLAWVRQQSQGRLLQAQSDPNAVAARLLPALALGATHPYARRATARSYDAVNLQDCLQFHQSLRPGGARLYVAGDTNRGDVARKFGARLPNQGASLPLPAIPAPAPEPARLVFADVPGATQATIVMWGPGPPRHSPDYYSATVMASIFAGNSLTSRLGADLRETMGSTYSVGGGFAYWKNSGVLQVSAPVAADRTGAAIEAMLNDAAAMISTDVSDDELRLARDGRITALPGRFATVLGTLGEFMDLAYYDLPITYYDDFAAHFSAVDRAAVRKAASDYLAPAGLHFVVVGDAKVVRPALDALITTGPLAGADRIVVDVDGNVVSH